MNEVRVRYYDCHGPGRRIRVADEAPETEGTKRHEDFMEGMIPKGTFFMWSFRQSEQTQAGRCKGD